jgi:UDP-N-acetylmuramoyl-tripeptide--D-alanyl-D-alanine ligase
MTIQELHNLFKNTSGVCTDTRKLTSDCLFFALSGSNFNGNKFAKTAIENGAAYAVIDDASFKISDQYILVNNALETLQLLANYHRKDWGKKIFALTGSNGKTTTKELLHAVLSENYNVLSTEGNFNNHIGVPLTLLKITDEHDMAIIEMGANHEFEIEQLSRIAEPDYALITNIGKAHLEGFGSQDVIAKSKQELFDFVSKNGGHCFVNHQDTYLQLSPPKDHSLFNTTHGVFDSFYCSIIKDQNHYKSNLVGNVNAPNLDAAITVGKYFGISEQNIQTAISNYQPSNNRSQKLTTTKNELILDAYNANPSSMQAAITDFSNVHKGNKLAILGTMAELGEHSEEEHLAIINLCKTMKLDVVFIGEGYKSYSKDLQNYYPSATDSNLLDYCKSLEGKLILLKGSRSQKLESLLDFL